MSETPAHDEEQQRPSPVDRYCFACDSERVLVAGIAVTAVLRGIRPARLPTDLHRYRVGQPDG